MSKKRKLKSDVEKVWVIAYINSEFIHKVNKELKRFEQVEAHIPTVKILQKRFKGKPHFVNIPLLFNYGFFRMPLFMALNPELLEKLQENISCIYGWVKDPAHAIKAPKIGRIGRKIKDAGIAIATSEEVSRMVKAEQEVGIFSGHELDSVKPGDKLILHGYPFEGMEAQIIQIDYNKKKVEVSLNSSGLLKSVQVDFENVFYTIYNGSYNPDLLGFESFDDSKVAKKLNKTMHYGQ